MPWDIRNVSRNAPTPAAWRALAWAAIVVAFLVPVWWFPYFPTQDGPAHLANALILRDYLGGDARAHQFYRIAWAPLPNWSCFALLAGLASVFPPLVAEKMLVSLYVLGFALAYRYFAGALGRDAGLLSLAAVLLVFNRCLWMGFYNYCLSLVSYFLVLGYLFRRWEGFGPRQSLVLGGLLALVYFTHLFGFVLAALSCLWIAATAPPRGRWKSVYVLAALAPSLVLALLFFHAARFSGDGVFGLLEDHLLGWIRGADQWERLEDDLSNLEKHLFGIYLDLPVTLGMGVALLYEFFLVAGFCNEEAQARAQRARRRAVAALGGALALLYFLVPDMLVFGKGGFWKARLAPLPPLLWLACVRVPSAKPIRALLTTGTLLLLGVNLGLVSSFVRACNRDLREFTSGLDAVGKGRVLVFHVASQPRWAVNPLRHAGDYYCLNSGNIDLGHHFATLLHSVVRLRPGLEEESGHLEGYPQRALVDTIVVWDEDPDPLVPPGFALVFRQGRLKILRRGAEAARSSLLPLAGRGAPRLSEPTLPSTQR